MGQRHQIYIVGKFTGKNKKTKKVETSYRALGAWHDQWCFGMRATTNLYRLVDGVKRHFNKSVSYDDQWSNFYCDNRYMDSLVKSVYGVDVDGTLSMVHNETNNDYLIDKDGFITPENGDNNDGCTLIVIDFSKKEVRGCFFTPSHVDGERWTPSKGKTFTAWTPERYLNFYYSKSAQASSSFTNEYKKHIFIMNNVEVKPITTRELKAVLSDSTKKQLKAA